VKRKIWSVNTGIPKKGEVFSMNYLIAGRNADSDRFFSYLKKSLGKEYWVIATDYYLLPLDKGL